MSETKALSAQDLEDAIILIVYPFRNSWTLYLKPRNGYSSHRLSGYGVGERGSWGPCKTVLELRQANIPEAWMRGRWGFTDSEALKLAS